ncbi:MAG TPA: helix-turn-helix domain-containing protein [Deltaproteobacteria bacterium]|nr:helix-turn-helix domain-containing protein [Deltaproteobacteria bacterium]HPP81850.1 helix-turn-helix domain-containing protein [Deltaproteobacteria bacterium]
MPQEGQTLGEYFRSEREKRGLDLKEIEERTKISAQTLIFLEEDRLDMLPPRTFLRGFLRVISKEFQFDEEELLAKLEDTLAQYDHQAKKAAVPGRLDHRKSAVIGALIAALVVLVLLVASLRYCTRHEGRGPADGPAGGVSSLVESGTAPS